MRPASTERVVIVGTMEVGRACFLTILQDDLNGEASESEPLIARWVDSIIYWPIAIWVFAVSYVVIFAYVMALIWIVPPRRPRR